MADESASEERTEEPTAKRLEKAREDGQVARSQELSVAAMMIGTALFMLVFGEILFNKLQTIFATGFLFDRRDVFSDNLLPSIFGQHAVDSILVLSPMFILAIVIAVGASGALGGYNFSIKALAPKASKINPLQGLKRIFGLKAVVDLTKALTKFLLVAGVLYLVVISKFDALVSLGFMGVQAAMSEAGQIISKGVVWVTLTLLIAAGIDVPYQLYEHNKKLKMTKQEVKDEFKDIEGRPEIKAQIRRKQREMSMASMVDAVAEADVVIVNPEHFAIALSYDPWRAYFLFAKSSESTIFYHGY
jgi:flagellar biosynthetic protein FlhB